MGDQAMKKAIPVDVYDKAGNLLRVELNDGEGNHIIDAVWDDREEQTSENRQAFRQWAYTMARRKGYEVYK